MLWIITHIKSNRYYEEICDNIADEPDGYIMRG
jgi:hypothetical protein